MIGLLLYGAPGSGKDTVTQELHEQDRRFVHFPRLKVGPGRTAGYRMTTPAEIDRLRAAGEIVWENPRYGASYAIDRAELLARLRREIPVIHLGQAEAIEAVRREVPAARWFVVNLWCPRDVAAERLAGRNTGDLAARLDAWDATVPAHATDLSLDSSTLSASNAATEIRHMVMASRTAGR